MIRNTGTRFVALGINLYDRVADKNIMALYSELPVYWDVYKLHLMIFDCTKDFSKEYKYTLGQDIKGVLCNQLEIPG